MTKHDVVPPGRIGQGRHAKGIAVIDAEEPDRSGTTGGRSRRRTRVTWAVVGVVVVLLAVLAVIVVRDLQRQAIAPPAFPSLQETPDPSLHGTLAYLSGTEKHPGSADKTGAGTVSGNTGPADEGTWCVRVVAVAGSPARNAYCIPVPDLEGMIGPQLRWLPGDLLEVTAFRSSGKGSTEPGWQRIVDVRTGAVEDVPTAEVPPAPMPAEDPAVGPDGEQVTLSEDDGSIEVVLETTTGTRTLMEATGNPNYGASLAGWSPDGEWILVDDGRLLVVTIDDPSRTWVLVDDPAAYGDVGSAGFRPYAITGADVLRSPG